jgi:hypothetical protein
MLEGIDHKLICVTLKHIVVQSSLDGNQTEVTLFNYDLDKAYSITRTTQVLSIAADEENLFIGF